MARAENSKSIAAKHAVQPKMIPNPLYCDKCEGRGYLVGDAEWEPYAVQCPDCTGRRPPTDKEIEPLRKQLRNSLETSPNPVSRGPEMLTTAEVSRRVAEVYKAATVERDDESAHSQEDKLYREVLKAIAHGTCDDPQACASQALMTQGIDFERWCA